MELGIEQKVDNHLGYGQLLEKCQESKYQLLILTFF